MDLVVGTSLGADRALPRNGNGQTAPKCNLVVIVTKDLWLDQQVSLNMPQ